MIASKPTRRRFVQSTLATAATLAVPSLAVAQAFPAKPIRLICPWPAGGSTDVVMREIDVLGVRADPNTCEEVIPLINNGKIKITPMITHHFPLEGFGDALKTFNGRLDNAVKVVIEP